MKRAAENLKERRLAPARRGLHLRRTDVELWRVSLDGRSDAQVADLHALLSPDEAERAAKFYFDRDRRRFIVGRAVLRRLLGRYVGCAPAEIQFKYGANGKPELAAPAGDPLHFNLAHSEGLAVYAFTRAGAVGVDLERVRDLPDWEHIASTCFSRADQAAVNAATGLERRVEFFRAWTRQEARLKATGEGLGGIEAPAVQGWGSAGRTDNPAFLRPATPPPQVFPLAVAEEFAGAFAICGTPRWATCYTWESAPTRDSGASGTPIPLSSLPVGAADRIRRGPRIPLDHSSKPGVQFL